MAKILTIDDSLTIRKLVDLILRSAGHEILLAENGVEGLRMAREQKPDLILLDYILPDIQSPEICRQLLGDPQTAEIPVLLISTNGGAIRQLYGDSRNVRDYLTKPFQAKVLQSVVEHLIAKRSTEAKTMPEPLPLPGAKAEDAEHGGGSATPPTGSARGTLTNTAPGPVTPATRLSPGAGSALANDGHAALRALLNARFRTIAKMIPDLEGRRGPLSAETYYLPFLLRNELLSEIAAEVSRAQLAADAAAPLIAGFHEWMGIDATLLHLGRAAATGVFSFKVGAETIDLSLDRGRVAMVGSHNARAYCAGASFNFRAIPANALASAVTAQQRDGTPVFVTLSRLGILRDPGILADLLREQGARALHRAMATPGTRYAFVPRESLSETARRFSMDVPAPQFILEVLRRVDDWLEIESTTGSVETIFALGPAGRSTVADLALTAEEMTLLDSLDGRSSLQSAASAANLALFPACAAAYRMIKLGVVRIVPGSSENNEPPQATEDAGESAVDFPRAEDAPVLQFPAPFPPQSNQSLPWPKF